MSFRINDSLHLLNKSSFCYMNSLKQFLATQKSWLENNGFSAESLGVPICSQRTQHFHLQLLQDRCERGWQPQEIPWISMVLSYLQRMGFRWVPGRVQRNAKVWQPETNCRVEKLELSRKYKQTSSSTLRYTFSTFLQSILFNRVCFSNIFHTKSRGTIPFGVKWILSSSSSWRSGRSSSSPTEFRICGLKREDFVESICWISSTNIPWI